MKHIHHLKDSWLLTAMVVAVVGGETIAWYVTKAFNWRFPVVAIGAVCVGLVAAVVSVLYDGTDD